MNSGPFANDARLWAEIMSVFADHRGLDNQAAELAARQELAVIRRQRHPNLRTWAPGDPMPDPPPRRVYDLDGAAWERVNDAGHGCYRMAAVDQCRYADSTEDVRGVRPWPYLLDSEGPLTEGRKGTS